MVSNAKITQRDTWDGEALMASGIHTPFEHIISKTGTSKKCVDDKKEAPVVIQTPWLHGNARAPVVRLDLCPLAHVNP